MPEQVPERAVKQVIVIRRDLKMRRGKEIAQGAHASMAWLTERIASKGANHADGYRDEWHVESLIKLSQAEYAWITGLFTKVTCQASSEAELRELLAAAQAADVLAHLITDAGLTEFSGTPTVTALAVGPDWSDRVDLVTGELELY